MKVSFITDALNWGLAQPRGERFSPEEEYDELLLLVLLETLADSWLGNFVVSRAWRGFAGTFVAGYINIYYFCGIIFTLQ